MQLQRHHLQHHQQQQLQLRTFACAVARQPGRVRPAASAAAGGGGGLFGGLKKALGVAQQQQQLGQPQQQPGQPQLPSYTVVQKGAAYELRLYDLHAVVETDYSRREEGYLALGSYKDGANAAGSRYHVTQPVVMSYHPSGRKVMHMFVGSPKQQQQQQPSEAAGAAVQDVTQLPAPSDPGIRLSVAGGELVAVMPFEGYITPEAAAAVRAKLADALQADGLALAPEEAEGFFRVAQYGQVHTLQTRLNEMMLRVQL